MSSPGMGPPMNDIVQNQGQFVMGQTGMWMGPYLNALMIITVRWSIRMENNMQGRMVLVRNSHR